MRKMQTDPDTLRIPAFRRKRSFARRASEHKLLLTALDRKDAGVTKEKLGIAPKKKKAARKHTVRGNTTRTVQTSMQAPIQWIDPRVKPEDDKVLSSPPRTVVRGKLQPGPGRKARAKNAASTQLFEAPFIGAERVKDISGPIGTVTHYYSKIHVAVVLLARPLSVGDLIRYQTASGEHAQVVESMEIDRQPVFRAQSGQEIGIKLEKAAEAGTYVR